MRNLGSGSRAVRGPALVVVALLAMVWAPGCESVPLDELLAGKACDASLACAPGYVCDRDTLTCLPEDSTPGAGGEGGAGGGTTACTSPSDCPEPQSVCEVPVCVGGECGISALPMGTDVVIQTEGDCKRELCDGLGAVTERNDADDVPVDGNPCTNDQCNSGMPENPFLEEGVACGSGTCDGEGTCVECVVASMCSELPPNDECQQRRCDAGQCEPLFTPAGTPVTAQSDGDCQQNVCDGQGGLSTADDDGDLPHDGNECTVDSCVQGSPSFDPATAGSPCGNNLSCDGSGNCTGCSVPADCGADSFCVSYACNGGVCALNYTQAGTVLPTVLQADGDCQELQCNGTGAVTSVADGADIPADDGNDCTTEVCSNGSPQFSPEPLNEPCSTQGGVVCDGAGSCVECNAGSQCSNQGTVCQTATCASGTCGLQDNASGTIAPVQAQTDGDCAVVRCDGSGGTTVDVDDSDLPEDGNDCTVDTCNNGVPDNTPAPAGTPCGAGGTCDGDGACTNANKPLGDGCSSGAECQSGACVDGVCCDAACSGACEACAATLTGGTDGTCAAVPAGQDPEVECGNGQTCDGGGACAFLCGQEPSSPPASCPVECTGGCVAGVCVVDCNGAGACTSMSIACPAGMACEVQCGGNGSCDDSTIDCPGKYACDVVCTGSCANAVVQCDSGTCDLACGGGNACEGTSLQCDVNRCESTCVGGAFPTVVCGNACDCTDCALPAGSSCADDLQCQSGACAPEGVCCDSACGGLCEACTMAHTGVATGTCAPVKAGTDPAAECAGQQACDGAGGCSLRQDGDSCTNGNQCQSGYCPPTEGVCCDTPCNGTCEGCRASVTGQGDGTCAFIDAGTDPTNECPGPQTCDGGGACVN